MIVSRFLLCIVAALAMHTWPAHADALSDAFNQGAILGRSGNTAASGQISGNTAQATVPNYSTAPPEVSYFGSPGLGTLSSAHVSACAGATGQADELCPAELQRGRFLADQSIATADLQHRPQRPAAQLAPKPSPPTRRLSPGISPAPTAAAPCKR
jgi:hypothetical protein